MSQDKKIKALMAGIDEVCNSYSDELLEQAADQMVRNHRSIQQRTMALFLQFVERMAKSGDEGAHDSRNAAACRAAQKIRDAFGKDGLPLMPLI